MKKLILFGAAIVIAFGASAQMSLVKDLAKKAASENPMELVDVLTKIEPALENAESAGDVLTWYTAGKAPLACMTSCTSLNFWVSPLRMR